MEIVNRLHTDIQTDRLKEGIKNKYRQYSLTAPNRFPDFEYNTNRANYEPLRASFEEELYVVRGLDRLSPTIHIPSTNTLALLFTDEEYVPGKKILNTCYSYAEGPTTLTDRYQEPVPVQPNRATPAKFSRLLTGGFVLLALITLSTLVGLWFFSPRPSGLLVKRPMARSNVPQEIIVDGNVANADIVWLVVRPDSGNFYYVQPAVKVQDNNWWISVVFAGRVHKADEGRGFQIRAFVNPTSALTSGQILRSWPDAELVTDVLHVVREKSTTK